MSVVDLYAVEAKFSQTKDEYDSLMRTLNHQCLGKYKSTKKCQKASELNAQLQTYLIEISNLLVTLQPTLKQKLTVKEQQAHILALSDYLEKDKTKLTTVSAAEKDSEVIATMSEYQYFTWFLCAVLVGSLVIYEMKNI